MLPLLCLNRPLGMLSVILGKISMELKRRLSLVVVIMTIALGSGHLTQNVLSKHVTAAAARSASKPVAIVLVAAGPQMDALQPQPIATSAQNLSFADATDAEPLQNLFTLPDDPIVQADFDVAVHTNGPTANKCAVSLDLAAEPTAMIAITVLAPCQPNKRVVLRHAGLAVTGKTSGTGALFMLLPAMTSTASVSVRFPDDQTFTKALSIPEADTLRRFGVQWLGDDAFQLHAFENGSDYGENGDVSAADPQQYLAGQPQTGGYLAVLGDDQVDQPMLAEVYTYPTAPNTDVRIVVEAAVTKGTCGREILGETLADRAGDVTITDLTLAMPDCTGIGDILVLKNLDPDLTIASAN